MAMLNAARDVVVHDGSFVMNIDSTSAKRNIDRILDQVAPNAILNAGGRADDVRCYPGTREEVLRNLEKWMNGEDPHRSRMMWLSGPAGAGKSAICQTVAERCSASGRYAANFFFFRGDGTRNRAQPLVATLAYQLRRFYPSIDEILTTADPHICSAPIEEQFIQLISSPVQMVQHSPSSRRPIVLVIDGLDECDDKRKQQQITTSLHTLATSDSSPFYVLVASRAEPHLVMAFNKLGNLVESIFLNDGYRPQDDIRRFVDAKFDEIKKVHHLADMLREHWPAHSDIDAIVEKSSGQFIYAATVMRFIQNSPASPALSLLMVQGVRPSTNHSPFAHLDAIYTYIFSRAHDVEAVKLCLGAHFIIQSQPSDQMSTARAGFTALLRRTAMIEIESSFGDLVAIVKVPRTYQLELVFYHASLSDYLKDESRSGPYFVDPGQVATQLVLIGLGKLGDLDALTSALWALEFVEKATTKLSQSLLDASSQRFNEDLNKFWNWNRLILAIKRLYFETDTVMFKLMLKRWIRCAYINGINIRQMKNPLSGTSASRYYHWYHAAESVRFTLKLNK